VIKERTLKSTACLSPFTGLFNDAEYTEDAIYRRMRCEDM
jgi:hypothetical protein